MPESELDRLDAEPQIVKLSTGFSMEVVRLKTRQLFRLLKVLTHGAGPALMSARLDFADDPAAFGQKLMGLVIISIPDAEEEFIQFLASMTKPAGVTTRQGGKLTKQEQEDNQALWNTYSEELNNPDPMDLIDIVEVIVTTEAPELQALGKRIAGLVETLRKTGADKGNPEPAPSAQELNGGSQENSPTSSTS